MLFCLGFGYEMILKILVDVLNDFQIFFQRLFADEF